MGFDVKTFWDLVVKLLDAFAIGYWVTVVPVIIMAQISERRLPKRAQLGRGFWALMWGVFILQTIGLFIVSLEVWGFVD